MTSSLAELEELRAVVRDFLEAISSEAAVRETLQTDEGYDAATWAQASEQLGLAGLAIPEEFGGSGFGLREAGIVFEEAGRALWCAPLLSGLLAAQALLLSGNAAACAAYLPGIAAGETFGSVAWLPVSGRGAPTVTVDAGMLAGSTSFVVDGHLASVLIVAAGDSLHLVDVDAGSATMTFTVLEGVDETRRLVRIDLRETPATVLCEVSVLDAVLARAAAVVAAEQVGCAARCLDAAVDYAKIRNQFDRPIGSFQAVKHRCAEMYASVESARAIAGAALKCADNTPEELPVTASIAKAVCSEAAVFVAGENIAVHGGIGFTWEHPAHLYYRRATSTALLFGTAGDHRELIATAVGL